ncbi:MAG: hypothetical protein KGD57_10725 [Candidatus Lokiarchaeota archaeon]|nr:hypothetical protein [Candidatus Lokiarchaeota archaeon]
MSKYYIKTKKGYQFKCLYNGLIYLKCPNNENSLCQTIYKEFPFSLLHKFDGKNIIKCLCG